MVQNLRAYFILNNIKTKWIMSVQKKNELSSMSQRSLLSPIKISGDLSSVATKKEQQIKLQKRFLRGGKKLAPCYLGVAFSTPNNPVAMGMYITFQSYII